ncbi:hypothetical protein ACFYWY_32110 [Streptomyces sp. NPDC002870]|uniref:hypothetical protein n=1 Tax=Streptomyces sp. NPDC002870 TaxID=3364666 RepID=UPI0036CFDB04
MSERRALLRCIRVWLAVFIVCLVPSGLTAFPLVHELRWVEDLLKSSGAGAGAGAGDVTERADGPSAVAAAA